MTRVKGRYVKVVPAMAEILGEHIVSLLSTQQKIDINSLYADLQTTY